MWFFNSFFPLILQYLGPAIFDGSGLISLHLLSPARTQREDRVGSERTGKKEGSSGRREVCVHSN